MRIMTISRIDHFTKRQVISWWRFLGRVMGNCPSHNHRSSRLHPRVRTKRKERSFGLQPMQLPWIRIEQASLMRQFQLSLKCQALSSSRLVRMLKVVVRSSKTRTLLTQLSRREMKRSLPVMNMLVQLTNNKREQKLAMPSMELLRAITKP